MGLTFSAAGTLSGSPTVENSPYTIEIVAEDDSCAGACAGVSKITDTISFTVTDGGGDPSWDTTPSDQTFTQYEAISGTTFTATANPDTNTISYSLTGNAEGVGLAINSSGELTGAISSLGTYTATITATDDDNGNFISESINITLYDAEGRDIQGYNSAGFNATGWSNATPPVYNELYDETLSP